MSDTTTSLPHRPIVVVPDGLGYDPVQDRALPIPSFAYRAVLNAVRERFPDYTVYLAPANHFGAQCTEQVAAADLLRDHRGHVITVPSQGTGYIDTRGNANQLRHYLAKAGQWPLGPIILISTNLHLRRAILCFRKEGFEIESAIAIPYIIPQNEFIVPRLWYYRFPFFHRLYEGLAFIRDILRPSTKG